MVLSPSDKTEEKAAVLAAKNNITEKGRLADQKLDEHTRWAPLGAIKRSSHSLSVMSLGVHGAF